MSQRMDRETCLKRLTGEETWDIAIVGGGATGMGIAVDAAARGFKVTLLEQNDFGKGTSSRSTKLVHGGVRYLQQGNVSLVMEALKERGLLLQNAPHLVHNLPFVVPNYEWWEAPFYGIGLKIYDLLAGKYGFGTSRLLSREDVLERIPTLQREGLRGGVLYHDGQFDDSRLLINLAQTAVEHGAALVNYAPVTGLLKDAGGITAGLEFRDEETSRTYRLKARCVINATGPFADALRKQDEPGCEPLMALSQGVHIVLDRSFLPGNTAIMVPHTRDGRVMFAIPWHGHVVVGTTDTSIPEVSLEPSPMPGEIDFILETSRSYLTRPPERADILSVFTGIRPLIDSRRSSSTATLSREHTINISKSGLLTITGGKWTTYRKMAEETVEHAVTLAALDDRPCVTRDLRIHGASKPSEDGSHLNVYGTDRAGIEELMQRQPSTARRLHPALAVTEAQVLWAVREEMARTVEDVLARRTRALYLNARAAREMVPEAARILAGELGRNEAWRDQQVKEFAQTAASYFP